MYVCQDPPHVVLDLRSSFTIPKVDSQKPVGLPSSLFINDASPEPLPPVSSSFENLLRSMASPTLETLPREVLQHIALLTTSTPSEPPTSAIRMIQTNKFVRHKLHSPPSDFHLYASIFHSKFDTAAISRRQDALPRNSILAAELLQRYAVLERIRAREIHPLYLHSDLSTILNLIVESDGLDEWHLRKAGLVDFILDVSEKLVTFKEKTRALSLLVLSLSLSRRYIDFQNAQWIQDLLVRIQPFAVSALASRSPCFSNSSPTDILPGWASTITSRHIKHSSSAAILLTLALVEATPLQFPHHVIHQYAVNPLLRPSLADLEAFAKVKAPMVAEDLVEVDPSAPRCLYGDSCSGRSIVARSRSHDREFFRPGGNSKPGVACASDLVRGLWEGSWLYYPCLSEDVELETSSPSLICRKPLQLLLEETSSASSPVSSLGQMEDLRADDGSEVTTVQSPVQFKGQTLTEHGEASGYWRCAGEVRPNDGLLTFKMHRMYVEDSTWTFEAFIHYDTVLVGRCWSGPSLQASSCRGIFCLSRVSAVSGGMVQEDL
ncbi:hypothetical protein BDV98DRAFT_421290 [Pterulicium gracile]|uniref:F-box domain-containing protein n=1 Tax=Pterulicium gracile TaxID=1884261 RepID=A0A5C3Q4Y9_9AGAR|nr:hypothetical protein BDV98DRAFT_421290 [Pterula gracilis]